MVGGLGRELSANERQLLDDLLAHDFPGVAALRVQAGRVRAKPGCTCGCGTIDFVMADADVPRSAADSPVPISGEVFGADGEGIGGIILFVADGRLEGLEIFAYEDTALAMPDPGQVVWSGPGETHDDSE